MPGIYEIIFLHWTGLPYLLVGLVVLYLIHDALRRLPARLRRMSPGEVFLTLIPLFGLIWVFIVVDRVSRSFEDYFRERGILSEGDCGRSVGLGWAVTAACMVIPLVGGLAGFAALVLMIVYVVKLGRLKKLVTRA